MSKRKKKSGNQKDRLTSLVLLITAIINLLNGLIEILEKLIT